VDVFKPRWTSASFLLYAGGLTVLGSALGSLAYLARSYGDGAQVLWSLLVLAVLYAIAHAFHIRDRWIAAGIFAFASVLAWAVFVGSLWIWFGWLHGTSFNQPFHGFSIARLSFVLLVIGACVDDRRRFRFPFISLITVFAVWFFVTDLISGGGNWTTTVTLLVGLVYLAVGSGSDSPSSFWWHLGSGLLIGGALLKWWHMSDTDWALIAVAALVFVAIAYGTKRSSWAVLATVGFFASAAHFAVEWSQGTTSILGVRNPRDWVPYAVFAFVGFLLVALGLRRRGVAAGEPEPRERREPAAGPAPPPAVPPAST
jgi:hypothetical protein